MTTMTLVLDSGFEPHRIATWRDAAELLHKGHAEVVELYDDVLRAVHREVVATFDLSDEMRTWFELGVDASDPDVLTLRMPAVIRLVGVLGRKKRVKFSRLNVLTRDRFTCQYCGKRKRAADLNFDHVIPRSHGGKTTFENVVMACAGPDGCNARKGARTPEQAGMPLLSVPARPKSLPIAALRMESLKEIPALWNSWLYWNAELEP